MTLHDTFFSGIVAVEVNQLRRSFTSLQATPGMLGILLSLGHKLYTTRISDVSCAGQQRLEMTLGGQEPFGPNCEVLGFKALQG